MILILCKHWSTLEKENKKRRRSELESRIKFVLELFIHATPTQFFHLTATFLKNFTFEWRKKVQHDQPITKPSWNVIKSLLNGASGENLEDKRKKLKKHWDYKLRFPCPWLAVITQWALSFMTAEYLLPTAAINIQDFSQVGISWHQDRRFKECELLSRKVIVQADDNSNF